MTGKKKFRRRRFTNVEKANFYSGKSSSSKNSKTAEGYARIADGFAFLATRNAK